MAFVVVTSLLGIVHHQLLQPHNPPLNNILDDPEVKEKAQSLSNKLRFLQAILLEKKTINQELDAKIREVAAEAEARIESQLRAVYLAAHNSGDRLHHTLQQVLEDFESLEEWTQNESEKEMVGREEEYGKIKGMIIADPKTRKVIPITGTGGIGKTTLAKRVYQSKFDELKFDARAWATVSQEYQFKEVLIRLLHCINPTTTRIYSENCDKLKEELRKRMLGKRYLLVIDDIWSCAAWDEIIRCFPDNSNGSRILITTRYNKVAQYALKSSECTYIHSPNFLNTQESWNLFTMKVFGGAGLCKPELESIGRCIVKKCQGLPLSIIVIAVLLAAQDKSLRVWQDVFVNTWSFDPKQELLEVFSLSYNYLPGHLKACLIYFGVFSKNSDIPVGKLIRLWVAEGFLKEEMNNSLEEVAESYLQDLISRNLVQVSKQSLDGKLKSCKIHDVLYDLCRKEAQRKALLSVEKQLQSANNYWCSSKCRWISCVSTHWPVDYDKIHSILYFGEDVTHATSNETLVLSGLNMLRVLDLSLVKFQYALPGEMEDLFHLRYLALSAGCGSLGNFQLIKLRNLQTLIICLQKKKDCRHLQLPPDILELPGLQHVRVDKRSSLYLPGLVKKNLQTLIWLNVIGKDPKTTDFKQVPELKELWVFIDNELPPNAFESLVDLKLLEKLKIEMASVNNFKFPTALPENLKKLTICSTYLPWEDMEIIGRLDNLEVLKLKNFAFNGPEWELSGAGFPRLKLFVISHSNLECWNADAEHFPELECLILKFCCDLNELPTDFESITTLRLIELHNCYSSLVKSANIIQKGKMSIGGTLVIHDHETKIG